MLYCFSNMSVAFATPTDINEIIAATNIHAEPSPSALQPPLSNPAPIPCSSDVPSNHTVVVATPTNQPMPLNKQKAFTKQSLSDSQLTCVNGNFQYDKNDNESPRISSEGLKRPRMVAEVKPMRMSYSDVLSKNVQINEANDGQTMTNRNSSSANSLSNGSTGTSAAQKSSKFEKSKSSASSVERKAALGTASTEDLKDPLNNQTKTSRPTASNTHGKSAGEVMADAKAIDSDPKTAKKKSANVPTLKVPNRTVKNGAAATEATGKRRTTNDPNASQSKEDTDKSTSSLNNTSNGLFYNITKTEANQSDKQLGGYAKSNQQRKTTASKVSVALNRNGANRVDKTATTSSYQQKRNNKSRQNSTYAMIWKLICAWFDYMVIFVQWLVALVCDVALLSVSITIEYCSASYQYVRRSLRILRNEITNRSGRPLINFTQLWQRFDNKFHKDSKFAIWRRIFAKKKPAEPIPDYYKNGRLPQTGDEAMYSLLNCKGKDAYR